MTSDTTGKPANFDQNIEAAVEAEICEFVRRDGASLRRAPETDSELVANSVVTLLQRVAGAGHRRAHLRTADPARDSPGTGRARSAQACRICASEPIGYAVDEDHR